MKRSRLDLQAFSSSSINRHGSKFVRRSMYSDVWAGEKGTINIPIVGQQ